MVCTQVESRDGCKNLGDKYVKKYSKSKPAQIRKRIRDWAQLECLPIGDFSLCAVLYSSGSQCCVSFTDTDNQTVGAYMANTLQARQLGTEHVSVERSRFEAGLLVDKAQFEASVRIDKGYFIASKAITTLLARTPQLHTAGTSQLQGRAIGQLEPGRSYWPPRS